MDITAPLAERMRPTSLAEFGGQEHLVGEGKLLTRLLTKGRIPSLLLWGPPGSGKTTLATILARTLSARFVFFSAVLSGVKDIRRIVDEAREQQQISKTATILFVDEIHRFNKGQQDALLPHVENGLFTLIGATTENPSFQVIAPLLSRSQVLVLHPLSAEVVQTIVLRALEDRQRGLGGRGIAITDEALVELSTMVDGDCRRALNLLETAANLAEGRDTATNQGTIDRDLLREAAQQRTLRYDADGEEHYTLISALHKSLRDSDPDGALYWLVRMLESGEDPLYLARRMIRFASEDIGNADPQALHVALNSREAYHILGSPEGELALVQCAAYLATAPKSNAVYAAYKSLRAEIKKSGTLPVPLHLRNAPTPLMQEIGYGKGYRYAHDFKDGIVLQEHMPDELKGATFYHPTNRGYEAVILDRLTKWKQILRQRQHHEQLTENQAQDK
ncbi:MAG: AAA family ATPase [Desulfobulbus propionicus]|nr:MAG: AAA family ATPase [Desulfobulbus propionicus]